MNPRTHSRVKLSCELAAVFWSGAAGTLLTGTVSMGIPDGLAHSEISHQWNHLLAAARGEALWGHPCSKANFRLDSPSELRSGGGLGDMLARWVDE
jgi:hypothetical protein